MRIGINTGPVVVSSLAGNQDEELTVVGDTVNVASRLEQAAPPNGILVAHSTYSHIRGVFQVRQLSPIQLKGKTEPVPVYQVISSKPRAFRMPSRGVWGIETQMVGREEELLRLQGALELAAENNRLQTVLIFGEAGMGKSRLLYEFRNWLQLSPDQAVTIFTGRASPEMSKTPYALVRDMLSFRFNIQDSDSADVARHKLEKGLVSFMGHADGPVHRAEGVRGRRSAPIGDRLGALQPPLYRPYPEPAPGRHVVIPSFVADLLCGRARGSAGDAPRHG
jgi:hypothetical protein